MHLFLTLHYITLHSPSEEQTQACNNTFQFLINGINPSQNPLNPILYHAMEGHTKLVNLLTETAQVPPTEQHSVI
jgi:hypothetical protein